MTQQNDTIIADKALVALGTNSKANEAVYNEWAASGKYEKETRQWGYRLPEEAASLLFRHATTTTAAASTGQLSILDAGAGDGLTGMALRNVGFTKADITGSDISQGMLEKAKERQCYTHTRVLDLNQPLTSIVADDTYDIINCIGTFTYLSPDAGTLAEFIRVVKPGGLICYSNRTDKLDQWRAVEDSLTAANKWKLLEKVGPIPYLPGNPDYGDKVQVVLFLYKVV